MVTLNTKKDFDSVYKSQKKWHNSYFILFFKENQQRAEKRIGFSVSKKIGNAVCRNLVKRRLRNIYRDSMSSLKNGDMILLAKVGLEKAEYKILQDSYK
ncbi:MAG: ribonuclease P protein component, partial [Helicobacter sp.]|nr:ribonuclease P protein component [Helicobacter sp.]